MLLHGYDIEHIRELIDTDSVFRDAVMKRTSKKTGRPSGNGKYEILLKEMCTKYGSPLTTRDIACVLRARGEKVSTVGVNANMKPMFERGGIEKLRHKVNDLIHWWHPDVGVYNANEFTLIEP